MSTVSTAIRINDQMSPVLRSMNKALNIVINRFEVMQSATADPINTTAISEARSELANVSVTLDQVEEGIRNAYEEQERYTREVQNTQDALTGITSKVMQAVAAYATLQTAQKATQISDRLSNTNARMSMIVDDGGSVQVLEQKIFESANRARANYMDVADSVAKLSLNAPDAFTSNDETILFAENLNKLFAIAGTETAAVNSATLQLTQALGSGVLRGEEFNAVFEAAPNIMQEVAEYMDVPIGQLRSMAAEGEITAEIVKNALLSATDEINSQFEAMPTTWAQVWNMSQNYAIVALNPVWEKLSAIANSQDFNNFVVGAARMLGMLGNILIYIFDLMLSLGTFICENWSFIAPVIGAVATALALYLIYLGAVKTAELVSTGVKIAMCLASYAHAAATGTEASATAAATAAQYGFNTALLACPLTWILLIIIAVIAAIYLVVAAINKATGSTISATGIITGVLSTAGAFIWNLFLALLDLVLGIINVWYSRFAAFANFFANLFNDPIASILYLFGDLADGVLAILEGIASAIDKVFGSNLAEAVSGWRGGLNAKIEEAVSGYGNGSYEKVMDELNLSSESLGFERKSYGDAWDAGYAWGANAADSFSLDNLLMDIGGYGSNVLDYDALSGNVSDIADNTGGIKDAVEISEEDLKYLRDVAEMETINRFTTAEISIDMGGVTNTINSEMDIDGFTDVLTDKLYESMATAAEGVHE